MSSDGVRNSKNSLSSLSVLRWLVHLQDRLCVIRYSGSHETSYLRSYALKGGAQSLGSRIALLLCLRPAPLPDSAFERSRRETATDRKSTRLNSSHANISYAVFCLKKNNPPKSRTHT